MADVDGDSDDDDNNITATGTGTTGGGLPCITVANAADFFGNGDLSRMERGEVIFTPFVEIVSVACFRNLKELNLIGNGLRRISGLEAVANSLVRLTLARQKLISMIGLENMPKLRELYLQENQITRIEGLEGAPNLQKLWVCSNAISKIENLHMLGDLRELWLQDNNISQIGMGLDHSANLDTLALSANPICDFKELKPLLSLPALNNLSFSDIQFAAAPIAELEGYRAHVVYNLRQIKILDTMAVLEEERQMVEDTYLKRVLEFNDRIEELKMDTAAQQDVIHQKMAQTEQQALRVKQKLTQSLKTMQLAVRDGRSLVKREHARQRKQHDEHLLKLKATLESLRQAHDAEVTRLTTKLQNKLAGSRKTYEIIRKRQIDAINDRKFARTIQEASDGQILSREIDDETGISEQIFLKTCINNNNGNGGLKVLTSFQFMLCDHSIRFANAKKENQTKIQCYCVVNEVLEEKEDSESSCSRISAHSLVDISKGRNLITPLVLFATAAQATRAIRSRKQEEEQGCCVLQCSLLKDAAVPVVQLEDDMDWMDSTYFKQLFQIHENADLICLNQPSKSIEAYVINHGSIVLPQFMCRVEDSGALSSNTVPLMNPEAVTKELHEMVFGINELQLCSSLAPIEAKANQAFSSFQHQNWETLDPETIKVREEQDKEIRSLMATLENVQKKILEEKLTQEQLIKSIRQASPSEEVAIAAITAANQSQAQPPQAAQQQPSQPPKQAAKEIKRK